MRLELKLPRGRRSKPRNFGLNELLKAVLIRNLLAWRPKSIKGRSLASETWMMKDQI